MHSIHYLTYLRRFLLMMCCVLSCVDSNKIPSLEEESTEKTAKKSAKRLRGNKSFKPINNVKESSLITSTNNNYGKRETTTFKYPKEATRLETADFSENVFFGNYHSTTKPPTRRRRHHRRK